MAAQDHEEGPEKKKYCKYRQYGVEVDPLQGDKAIEFKILSCQRPHMRSFHFAWFSFFMAFVAWFAMVPLMPAVLDTIAEEQDIQLKCTDKACNVCNLWNTEKNCSASCELSATWNDMHVVTAGGHGSRKNSYNGSYPAGKDKYDDQTGEKCKTIKKRKKIGMVVSNIASVGGCIIMRYIAGPLSDVFGPRIISGLLLIICSVPTALSFTINSFWTLSLVRGCIGLVGATFVCTQYWSIILFAKEKVGTASAITGGWGNLGGGVTQLFMAGMFAMIQSAGHDEGTSWKLAMIIPAILMFLTGIATILLSDDSPKGNYGKLLREGVRSEQKGARTCWFALQSPNTYLMALQYAACFGVELHVNHSLAWYFYKDNEEEKGPNVLSLTSAGMVASLFGWMNLFARALGGWASDEIGKKWGMRGKLWLQVVCVEGIGVTLLIFSRMESLGAALAMVTIMSVFAFAACGTTYGILPFVEPRASGAVSGVVGAGGNLGAVAFSLLWLFNDVAYADNFMIVAFVCIAIGFTNFFVFIPGHAGLICGTDDESKRVLPPDESNNEPIQETATVDKVEGEEGEMKEKQPEVPAEVKAP